MSSLKNLSYGIFLREKCYEHCEYDLQAVPCKLMGVAPLPPKASILDGVAGDVLVDS